MSKKEKRLILSQKQQLEDWDKKIKSGEALKEAKRMITSLENTSNPEFLLRKLVRKILPKAMIKGEELTEEETKKLSQSTMDYGLENYTSMMTAVEMEHRGLMFNLKKSLIGEFDCKNTSEKILIDIIINAYSRNLSASKMLVHTATTGKITPGLNNFLSIMSKEVDRANRHLITALETLKQFKQPELNVNVKTNTAFISQSQEFNNNKEYDEKDKVK